MASLATQDDMQDRLGRALEEAEVSRAQAALDDVSEEVRDAWPGIDAIVPTPARVVGIVARAAMRVLAARTDGVKQESTGPFSLQYTDDGALLTSDEVDRLRGMANRGSAKSIQIGY